MGYSSNRPCPAALSRQLLVQGFLNAFEGQASVEPGAVATWLRRHGTLATPHSKRSEARVAVQVTVDAPNLILLSLIDRIEQAAGTPLRTAVKSADEQAFAALNGKKLMLVEDAERRILISLEGDYANSCVHVRHLESLHPHDVVASVGWWKGT